MRMEMPDEKRLVHEVRIPIRRGDMNGLGHVFPPEKSMPPPDRLCPLFA